MRTWKDNSGNTWNIDITVGSVKKVKADTGIDLLALAAGDKEVAEKLTDVFTFAEVLWSLSEKQAQSKKIEPEQFSELLGGSSVEEASRALLDDIIEFFPEKKRAALMKVQEKAEILEGELMAELMEEVEKMDLRAEMQKNQEQQESSSVSTSVPVSSE